MQLHHVLARALAEYPPGPTLTSYRIAVRHLQDAIPDRPLNNLTPGDLEAWKVQALGRWAHATVHLQLAVLRLSIRKAERDGWRGHDPTRWVRPPRGPHLRRRILSYVEEEALRGVMTPADFELIALALDTGLRREELFALPSSALEADVIHVTGKGGQLRTIPLTERALGILERRAAAGPWIVPAVRSRHRYTDGATWIRRRWTPALRAAGIPAGRPRGMVWHGLRHTFASRLADAGVSTLVIQQLLGHSSVVITQRYVQLAPATLHHAIHLLQ